MHLEIAPHPALEPFVDRFWCSASRQPREVRRILPDGCIDIILDANLGSATVVGTMTRSQLRQHLARLFRCHVGISPKHLARVARLQRALGELHGHPSLAALAAQVGYVDEAHMAKDFRELAQLSPGQARASRGSIFPIQSLLEAS